MTDPRVRKMVDEITAKLTAEGKLIEAGWQGLRILTVPEGAPKVQLKEMRQAFFAGAQHLLASMMTLLDPDAEPTEQDMERMSLIHAELEQFVDQLKAHIATDNEPTPTGTGNQLGSGPIEERYFEDMNALAGFLDHHLNREVKPPMRTTGFVLLVFPFGDDGRMNYISNANRENIVTALRERDHEDCEDGTVSSTNGEFVWVRFGAGEIAQACDPGSLVKL